MSDFKPPPRMNFDGDIAHNWGEWYQLFQLYLETTESTEKSDGTKIAMLLMTIGPDGIRRFNQLVFTPDTDKAKNDKVVEKSVSELSGEKRVVFNRFKFWEFKRAENQGFDDFLVKLRVLAGKCDFASAELNNMLRDKIVFVTTDKRLQERLLREKDLTFEKAVDICRAAKITNRELLSMSQKTPVKQVHAVAGQQRGNSAPSQGGRQGQSQYRGASQNTSVSGQSARHHTQCSRCGKSHGPNLEKDCAAWGHLCYKCKGKNHFKKFCRSKSMHTVSRDYVQHDEPFNDYCDLSDDYFMGTIDVAQVGSITRTDDQAWFETINVAGSKIRMKIDTGAEANSVPHNVWERIEGRPMLTSSHVTLRAFGGASVEHVERLKHC